MDIIRSNSGFIPEGRRLSARTKSRFLRCSLQPDVYKRQEYIRDAAASFPDDTGFETEEIQEAQEETLPEGKELLHDKTRHGVYEGASDKAENFKSGAYTLLTAGVIGLVVVGLLLSLIHILRSRRFLAASAL